MDEEDLIDIKIPPVADDGSESEHEDDLKDSLLGGEQRRRSDPGIKPSPMPGVNLISRFVTFSWLNPLLSQGSKKPLEAEELYGLRMQDSTSALGDKLQREWGKERYLAEDKGKTPSLSRAIVKAFGMGYLRLSIFAIITDALRIIQPIFLGLLIGYFNRETKTTQKEAFMYALAVCLCSVMSSFLMTPFTFLRQCYGMKCRIACTSLVYNKVLKLSNAALACTTTGNIVNLVSSDTQKFDWACFFLHYLVLGPIEAVAVLGLLWREIGASSLAGMGLLFIMVPMQIKMGDALMYFRRQASSYIDERVKLMNEAISGMRVIKLYTWEDSITQWISKIRKAELSWFRKLAFVRGSFLSFFFSSSVLVTFITFMTYVLTGHTLTAQKVFTCLSLFNSVRIVMTLFFPIAITLMNEGRVSIERIQRLLLLDELNSHGLVTSNLRPKLEDCGIEAENVCASWNKNLAKPTLSNLNFEVSQGELLAVIGAVGSGKSSLLMSILGELPLTDGRITVRGKIGYASQQAWIYNSSLQQNIIFGSEYNESRYSEVIKACALQKDIDLLADGDMTLVGERGVSLSGGQRARVNLARAVYADADVYIMDDPLSAVDADVGRHLFDNLTIGSFILKGNCIGQGTYQELAKSGFDFMALLIEEQDEDSAIESESDEPRVKRAFSRLQSQHGFPLGRSDSVQSRSSHRASFMLESQLSIMTSETEVSIFDENILPKETKQEGAVTLDTYVQYFKSLHSLGASLFVVLLFAVTQVVFMLSDVWLSYWCNEEEEYLTMSDTRNTTNSNQGQEPNRDLYLGIYSVFVVCLLFFTLLRTQLFFKLTIVASRKLHEKMFNALLRAPSYFFDTNSIGRILNRFSKDMGFVDDMMPFTYCDFLQTLFVVVGILALVASNNPITFAVVIPIVLVFWYLRSYYMNTSREVKRIEGITLSAGVVGLTLSYAIKISGVFQQCVKQSAEVENLMTSVERILEYCNLEPEAPRETDTKPPDGWPPKGVVGRTGAGKSSLLSTLFRLAEPTGVIKIDGINIQEIGLKDLRSKLSIIPQEPVLFSGTMRRNIDPFSEHSDLELWRVLEEVHLKVAVESTKGMDTEFAEAGSNFSVGQRQLVCLARAILRQNKILVIDEATANVDPRTDALIQATIREKFKHCTVLTIAHRLHTIMDSDRVMVLDAGRLIEFDAPYALLKNPKTIFAQLVTQTGPTESGRLFEIARQKFYSKKAIPEVVDEEIDGQRRDLLEKSFSSNAVTIIVSNGSGVEGPLQFESTI
ncbi:Multidrug resistance-associated protein 4 [Stylophora pistillata]|uniref:Multidrug resistance-associated protein 4 n=1 Tax=Stylophora pistillata TaxID=50429 RepID=A0A2B4RSU6_STYPI|nr:Multidrug resistance-associated protein 4 [Stylophora pistillata]